jgi:hypothetical protein
MHKLMKAGVKSAGGFSMGATVGAVKELAGEEAASYTKAAITAGGVLGEIFAPPESNWSELAKAGLYYGTGSLGEDAGSFMARKGKEANHRRNLARIKQELVEDLSDEHVARLAQLRVEAEADRVVPAPKSPSRPVNGTHPEN